MVLRPEALSHPLAAVLGQVTPQSCPSQFNFHCHTTYSDGSLHPGELARQAAHLGLRQLAVTDHHSIESHAEIVATLADLADAGEPVPVFWRGVEISCLLEGCLVHVLALGFGADHAPLAPYLQRGATVGADLRAEAVVAAIRAADGLALLAHPARYRLPHQRLIAAAAELGFDGG